MPNGITLNAGVVVGSPIPLDAKYGPYDSVALALSDLSTAIRHQGLTVGIKSGDSVVEYWFKDGVANENFVEKQSVADWNTLANKPETFTPSDHEHTLSNITDAGTAAASDSTDFATAAQGAIADTAVQPADLAAVATSGDYDDLTNKPTLGTAAASDSTAFAAVSHTHTASDIDSGSTADGTFLQADGSGGAYFNNISFELIEDVPATFPPSSHTHGNLSNDGKIGSTSGLPLKTGTDGVVEAGEFGTGAGEFCEGDDARLSDARTPTTHAASHATGGSDAISPSDIGAQSLQSIASITVSDSQQLNAARNQRVLVNSTAIGPGAAVYLPATGNVEGDRLEVACVGLSSGALSVRTGQYDYTVSTSMGLGQQRTFIYTSGAWTIGTWEAHTHPVPAPEFTSSAFRVTEYEPVSNLTQKLAFSLSGLTLGETRTLDVPDASGTISLADHLHDDRYYTETEADTLLSGKASTNLVGSPVEYVIACSDETTALTAGLAKVTFRAPITFELTSVSASVTVAPTGSTLIVDVNNASLGYSVFSTKLSIDAGELTSATAQVPAVIDATYAGFYEDDGIVIDIDQIGSTVAGAGLKVILKGTRL